MPNPFRKQNHNDTQKSGAQREKSDKMGAIKLHLPQVKMQANRDLLFFFNWQRLNSFYKIQQTRKLPISSSTQTPTIALL